MSVSDKDREAALHVIAEAIYGGPAYGKASKDKAGRVLDALVSLGWGPTRQVKVDTLLAARDSAREARRLCWAEDRDEHTIRHWSATAGWLASRAKKIGADEEPDWPDAANSARTEVLDDVE